MRLENGEFIEVHRPLDDQETWLRVSYDAIAPLEIEPEFNEHGVRRKGYKWDRFKKRLSHFYYEDRIEPVRPSERDAAHH